MPRVIQLLRTYLQEQGIREHQKLPPERELAAQLKVGRPALREAIKALSMLDVLESRQGDGTYLKSLEKVRQALPQNAALPNHDFTFLELLEVRKMFEPRAAGLAAIRASESQLRLIERERAALHTLTDPDRIAERDLRFHTAILEAAGNPVLTAVNRTLAPLLIQSRRLTARSAPGPERMHADHRRIMDALLRREPPAAEQAMLDHLHSIGMDLITERP